MGLLKRLHRITIGRIEALLDRVEDPEIMFPQLIREMEDQLRKATEQEACAIAEVKRSEREVEALQDKISKLGRGAACALQQDDEKIAREALAAQIDAERALKTAQANAEALNSTCNLATAGREQIQQQLVELKAQKSEILTRARIAKTRKNIQKTVSTGIGSTDSILDAVAKLEVGIEETEAELEIQAKLAVDARINPSLAKKLKELEQSSEIDLRLNELKAAIS